MLLIILILIFARPFISSLAFPYLNIVYSQILLVSLSAYIIYKKVSFSKIRNLLYPFGLFFLSVFLSVIFSQDKPRSFSEIYNYIICLFLFLIAASLSQKDKMLVIRTIILSGLVIACLAIYQYYFGFKHLSDYLINNKLLSPSALDHLYQRRVFLPFVTSNALGGYLTMIILLASFKKNWIWILPVFYALLLTGSLGALISLFLALIILFYLRGKLRIKDILVISGLLAFISFIFILRSSVQKEYLQPIFSTVMRLKYWQEALKIIIAHPFLGVGLGNFNSGLSRYAHNSYLQIWAETGIVGLFSFIWIICAVLKICFKNLTNPLSKNQITGLIAAIAVFLIHNFLDFTFFLPEVSFIWWVILGIAVI